MNVSNIVFYIAGIVFFWGCIIKVLSLVAPLKVKRILEQVCVGIILIVPVLLIFGLSYQTFESNTQDVFLNRILHFTINFSMLFAADVCICVAIYKWRERGTD